MSFIAKTKNSSPPIKKLLPPPLKHEAPFWETIPRKKIQISKTAINICYLAAPWPRFRHYWGDSFIHLFLIATYLSIFDLMVTMSFITHPFYPMLHHVLTQSALIEGFHWIFFELKNIYFKEWWLYLLVLLPVKEDFRSLI